MSRPSCGADPQRNAELARIHVMQAQLEMDDASYRSMLLRVTGKRSAADIGAAGRAAVIAELLRLGAPAPKSGGRVQRHRPRSLDRQPYLRKIDALLANAGRSWDYAHALARRMGNVDRLEFASAADLRKIVAALAIDARRRSARAEP